MENNRYFSNIHGKLAFLKMFFELTEQVHSVFCPLRSLTTPLQVSKHWHPLLKALPVRRSPKHSFELWTGAGLRRPVASDWERWCVFLSVATGGNSLSAASGFGDEGFGALSLGNSGFWCFSFGEVGFWCFSLERFESRRLRSSERMRFFSLVP